MKKLLQLEWLKIYNYKTARIFIILYCFFLFGLILLGTQKFKLGTMEVDLVGQGIFNYPQLWNFTTYFTAIIKIFLAFIIITTVVNEFQNRTFKQNIIDGLTKKEFLASKVLTIVILSAVSTILVFIFSLIFGAKYNTVPNPEYKFAEVGLIVAYFFKLVAFLILCLLFSILIRKSAFTFVLLFLWWFVEGILGGIEKWMRLKDVLADDGKSIQFVTDYLPLSAMSNSIPAPIGRLNIVKTILQPGSDVIQRVPWEFVLASAGYAIVFVILSYVILKKRDW
ncbi:MAG TPA: ABC transporter permease [Saprospiraceae bacterium]|jgi:ABC-2 type transport system permease protein|nr:ABC transporter permease [Saprospiraceae bacterium]